jgi:hypothetical protein
MQANQPTLYKDVTQLPMLTKWRYLIPMSFILGSLHMKLLNFGVAIIFIPALDVDINIAVEVLTLWALSELMTLLYYGYVEQIELRFDQLATTCFELHSTLFPNIILNDTMLRGDHTAILTPDLIKPISQSSQSVINDISPMLPGGLLSATDYVLTHGTYNGIQKLSKGTSRPLHALVYENSYIVHMSHSIMACVNLSSCARSLSQMRMSHLTIVMLLISILHLLNNIVQLYVHQRVRDEIKMNGLDI